MTWRLHSDARWIPQLPHTILHHIGPKPFKIFLNAYRYIQHKLSQKVCSDSNTSWRKFSRKLCVMRRCRAFPPVKESPTLLARSKRKPTKCPPNSPQAVWPPTSLKYLWQGFIASLSQTNHNNHPLKSEKVRRTNLCRNRSMSDPKNSSVGAKFALKSIEESRRVLGMYHLDHLVSMGAINDCSFVR